MADEVQSRDAEPERAVDVECSASAFSAVTAESAAARAAARLRGGGRNLSPTHVLALQRSIGNGGVARLLQRQPKPTAEAAPDQLRDYSVALDQKARTATVLFRDRPWVTVTWKVHQPVVKLSASNSGFDPNVRLEVISDEACAITVERSYEDEIIASMAGAVVVLAYDFRCDGTVAGITTLSAKPIKAPVRLAVREARNLGSLPREGGTSDRLIDRTEIWEHYQLPDTFQSFKNIADLRRALERNKSAAAAVVRMPDGGFVMRELSERELRRLADDARRSRYKPEQLESVRRYHGALARGTFESLIVEGVEYKSLDALADLYFDDPFMAGVGSQGSTRECEVFEMGSRSYGRRPLSHADALARLDALDKLTADAVARLETEPGHRFHALWVKGVSDRVWELDSRYFSARDAYRRAIAALGTAPDHAARQDIVERLGTAYRDYIQVEADRERPNPAMVAGLRTYEELGSMAEMFMWTQVADYAQQSAIDMLFRGAEEIRKVTEDDALLQRFALSFPAMSETQRDDVLRLIGVPDKRMASVKSTLARTDSAVEVALGNTVDAGGEALSLDVLRGYSRKALEGLEDIIGKLRRDELRAIEVEGPFGDSVRAIAYKQFGFKTLRPNEYPHKEQTRFLPAPASGNLPSFSNLGELLFANQARRFADVRQLAILTGVAVATAAVVLTAGLAGAAVAGLFLAEGTWAYFLASGAIAGFLLAGVELGVRGLSGEELSWGEALKTLAVGTATGAFFGGVGRVLKGAGTALRLTAMGLTFFTYSAGAYRIRNKKFPWESPDFALWFYENALTFVLIEAGGVATRPISERVGIWARAKRLGVAPEKLAAFRADAMRLNRDLASFVNRPQRAASEGEALQGRYTDLLKRQKALVEEVAAAIRGKEKSAVLEQELKAELATIEAQLQSMEASGFLREFKIAPIGESQTAFEYSPGPNAKARFEQFFSARKGTVTEDPDGRLLVSLPGEPEPFVFVPAGVKATPVAGPGGPAAKVEVDVNTATAKEIADKVPGIGKQLAEKVVAEREKAGGSFKSVDDLRPILKPAAFAKAAPFLTTKPPPPPKPLAEVQEGLANRRAALLERADRAGISDPALERIRKLRPLERTTEKSLAEAEQLIAAAEKTAGVKVDEAAKRTYDAARKRVGAAAMAEARGDALSDMTDTQVGEALIPLRGLRGIGPAQIRAAMHAYRSGVDLTGFLEMAKGMPLAERNFALETYARLKDARVPGADRVLTDMGRGRLAWDGAMWAFEAARYAFGIEKIAAFEVSIRGEGVRRDYDVVLKDGTKIELKNWATWDNDAATKLGDQFVRDIILGRYEPATLRSHRYVFREPAAKTGAEIRSFLRAALVRHLNEQVAANKLTADQSGSMLDAFDREAGLVVISSARYTGAPMIPAVAVPVIPLPPPDPNDKHGRQPVQVPPATGP